MHNIQSNLPTGLKMAFTVEPDSVLVMFRWNVDLIKYQLKIE